MRHQTLDELKTVANVGCDPVPRPMTKQQRLLRWAELLERRGDGLLLALAGTEYQPPEVRGTMRSPGSALSVAAEDPVLRAEGLKDDTYGEAKRFFEMTDTQLHDVVCYCHVGAMMPASRAAYQVRRATKDD